MSLCTNRPIWHQCTMNTTAELPVAYIHLLHAWMHTYIQNTKSIPFILRWDVCVRRSSWSRSWPFSPSGTTCKDLDTNASSTKDINCRVFADGQIGSRGRSVFFFLSSLLLLSLFFVSWLLCVTVSFVLRLSLRVPPASGCIYINLMQRGLY